MGWSRIPDHQTAKGLKNTLFSICARSEGRAVGFARVLGDSGYTAVIADVMVMPQYQGNGIGKNMINEIMNYIKGSMSPGDRVLVYLMANKNRESFYKQFGFVERPCEEYGAGMTQWLSAEG